MGWLWVATLVYLAYVLLLAVTRGASNVEFVWKEVVLTIFIVGAYTVHLSQKFANQIFFRRLCSVLSALGWSSVITLGLSAAVGLESLRLFTITVEGYEGYADTSDAAGGVFFPLTMIYNAFTSGDLVLMRSAGFFRESGIFQAICCSCVIIEALTRRSWLVLLGLALGVITSFSSVGIGLLVLSGLVAYSLNTTTFSWRLGAALCASVAVIPVVLYAPAIGINAKLETHGSSISDRWLAAADGLRGVLDDPVGVGLYSSMTANASINLLAAASSIGVVGVACQLIILSGWRGRLDFDAFKKMALCLPLLITALAAQPIAGAPFVYVLTMIAMGFANSTVEPNRGFRMIDRSLR